jgi:hypothetical protein
MIAILLLLLACIGGSWLLGSALLRGLVDDAAKLRRDDRVLLEVWLGLVVAITAFYAASLIHPLTLNASAGLAGAILLAAFLTQLNDIPGRIKTSQGIWIPVAVMTAGCAAYVATGVKFEDTNSYHMQIVNWMTLYGLVPGLSLVDIRLGTNSSWFSLPAIFNHGPLTGRTATFPGGLIWLLGLLHLWVAVRHILQGRARFSDWMMVYALAVVFLFIRHFLVASPAPDLTVLMLAIVVAWLLLIDHETHPGSDLVRRPALVAVVLAAGAFPIRASAAPILAIAGLSYLLRVPDTAQRARALLLASGVAAPFLLVAVTANVVLSGCPLFPSSLLCQPLPWSLSPEEADAYSAVIRDFHRWGWRHWMNAPRDQDFAWLLGWLRVDRHAFGMLMIALISIGIAMWKSAARANLRNASAAIVLGVTGIAFVMTNAPGIRFLTGYVAILIGVGLASLTYSNRTLEPQPHSVKRTRWYLFPLLAALFLLVAGEHHRRAIDKRFMAPLQSGPYWLVPPRLASQKPPAMAINESGIRYLVPQNGICGDLTPPCATKLDHVSYRDPEIGAAAGFRRRQ